MAKFTASTLEEAILDYLASLDWQVAFDPVIAPNEPSVAAMRYCHISYVEM
jgi:hypothetical protein